MFIGVMFIGVMPDYFYHDINKIEVTLMSL